MAKKHAYKTRKALTAALQDAITDAPAALSVKLGTTTLTVAAGDTYVGTAVGKDYGALQLGNDTMLFELDHRSGGRTARLIAEPDAETLGKIAADLLPEPEEPEEVKTAREALAGFAVPKGYKVELVKGKLTLVDDDSAPATRKPYASRAPKGEPKPKAEAKPAVEVGLEVKGLKGAQAGKNYKITNLDRATGYAVFVNTTDANDDKREKVLQANGKVAPAFWARWSVA